MRSFKLFAQSISIFNQSFTSLFLWPLNVDQTFASSASQTFQCPIAAFSAECSQCNRVWHRWSVQYRRWFVADLWHGTTVALRWFERQNESCEVHLLIWRYISHDQNRLLRSAMCHHTETRNGRVKLVIEITPSDGSLRSPIILISSQTTPTVFKITWLLLRQCTEQ